MQTDVGIIGGGLAGLTAAIHLLKHNFSVTLFEKNSLKSAKFTLTIPRILDNFSLNYFTIIK